MYIYALSRPYSNVHSGLDPIDEIPLNKLQKELRCGIIAESFRTGGLLVLTEENTKYIEYLVEHRYLKLGIGPTVIQAMTNCINGCKFKTIKEHPLNAQMHIWPQHQMIAKELFPGLFRKFTFKFSEFTAVHNELTVENAVIVFDNMLKNLIIEVTELH